MDAIAEMKAAAREGWASFGPFEATSGTAAPALVAFAGVTAGARVLDVACGTGVVAITAARLGAVVEGLDLTPALLDHARENAAIAQVEIPFHEGDVEALPFADAQFDFVLSQFGHMFGPRPDITTSELLRVLAPGGTLAFSTWPPDLFIGSMLALIGSYAGPPPAGASSPVLWGDPHVVRERLGDAVRDLVFDIGRVRFPALSPAHARLAYEANAGPLRNLVASLADDPDRLAELRVGYEALIERYFEGNAVRQDFLMTRAIKR